MGRYAALFIAISHRKVSRLIMKGTEIILVCATGFSSEIGTKLRESAVRQGKGSCYSRAALSSNDSKTLYSNLTYPKKKSESHLESPNPCGGAISYE